LKKSEKEGPLQKTHLRQRNKSAQNNKSLGQPKKGTQTKQFRKRNKSAQNNKTLKKQPPKKLVFLQLLECFEEL
jgi:hypothetical protein